MATRCWSRAGRLILKSRCWPSQRCATINRTPPVFRQSCQHRCTSSQPPTKTAPSTTTQNQEDTENDTPISYTSSKAVDWSVHNSYGRHKKRPWYKVAPISIGLTVFMAWVFLRKETEIDRQLEVHLHERLPNLFPDPATGVVKVAAATESSEKGGDEETKKDED